VKKVVAIFAHPDDEAFGPGGTLALLAKEAEVTLICVTNGAAGECAIIHDESLEDVRKHELHKSAEILGIKKVIFLRYHDGKICNDLYHEIADKLHPLLVELKPDTLISFEPRGVSGHIDHIAISFITTYLFQKLPFIKQLLYFCLHQTQRARMEATFADYFVYFPDGYTDAEIGKVVDITTVLDTKITAMRAHASQEHDVERILHVQATLPREEYFLVKKK
jgi:LmbE family N-acetylglucosaminyl deacetylase